MEPGHQDASKDMPRTWYCLSQEVHATKTTSVASSWTVVGSLISHKIIVQSIFPGYRFEKITAQADLGATRLKEFANL